MVTPRTGKPRGRPRKSFLEDPERYAIALSDALAALGLSEPDSFAFAAAILMGEEVAIEWLPNGGARIRYGRVCAPGEPTTTILGKADTLRGKAKHRARKGAKLTPFTRDEMHWRQHMALCIMVVLGAKDEVRCAEKVRQLAAEIGEAEFCESQLIPMLKRKFEPPDFSPPD